MKVIKITKTQAVKLNLTGAKPSASVRVGSNTLYQPATGRIVPDNNLRGLCKRTKDRK